MVLVMTGDIAQEMDRLGTKLETEVVARIRSGVPPPNAPSTIKKKKSTTTLIDEGDLIGSVTHQLSIDRDLVELKVGIFDPVVAETAAYNEFGVPGNMEGTDPLPGQRIPTRSFLRATFDESVDKLLAEFEDRVAEQIETDWIGPKG